MSLDDWQLSPPTHFRITSGDEYRYYQQSQQQQQQHPLYQPHSSNVLALLILPLLCALGLFGNLLVCLAIWFDRRLHNVTNYFLFSLALADLLVCGLVMPLSLLVEVHNGVWLWSFSLCLLYVYADVFLCSASIVHMSVISLDRYLGISKPLKARSKSRTMITIKITFVWVITVIISCPIAIAALVNPDNIFGDNWCAIANRAYMIYGSTFAFLIPSAIMAITYVKTTSLLNQQVNLVSSGNSSQPMTLRRTVTQRHQYSSLSARNSSNPSFRGTPLPVFPENELELSNSPDDSFEFEGSRLLTFGERTASAIFALASKISRREPLHTTNAELASEHKATRVLAVVFGCFFICWTPFFVANFAVGFCGMRCVVPPGLASFFLWLGYFSSTINPLIYTIFNRRFRQAFLRILRCQCMNPLRRRYISNYSRKFDTDGCTAAKSRKEHNLWRTVVPETRKNSTKKEDKLKKRLIAANRNTLNPIRSTSVLNDKTTNILNHRIAGHLRSSHWYSKRFKLDSKIDDRSPTESKAVIRRRSMSTPNIKDSNESNLRAQNQSAQYLSLGDDLLRETFL